jgi:hypothetical protein
VCALRECCVTERTLATACAFVTICTFVLAKQVNLRGT